MSDFVSHSWYAASTITEISELMSTANIGTVLVTGGVGFVGTHLCRKLIEMNYSVLALDLRKPTTVVPGVEYIQGDVRDKALLASLIANASTVYHLAATVSVPLCQKDPLESYSNNFDATLIVLETIRKKFEDKKEMTKLVFASTAALYGSKGDDGRALKEHDIAEQFMSFYAAQKHASEEAIQLYRSCYGIPAVIFRFFNIFGPGQDPTSPYSGVITIFAKFAKEGRAMPLNGGGHQTRDFVSVYDIVQGCTLALSLPEDRWNAKPMNLGTGKSITVRQLAQIIKTAINTNSEITVAAPREGDVVHSKADITRAKETVGYIPTTDLEKGLSELLKVI